MDKSRDGEARPKSTDWRSVGIFVLPYLIMIGIAVALLPQVVSAHMVSGVWTTICAAFGIK